LIDTSDLRRQELIVCLADYEVKVMSLSPEFWQNLWPAVAAIATAVQTVAIVGALAFAVMQTKGLQKQIRLARITGIHQQMHEMNSVLLRDKALGEIAEEKPKHTLASQILNTFETMWELSEANLIDKDEWEVDRELIKDFMAKGFMQKHWLGDPQGDAEDRVSHRNYYARRFRNVIDCALPEDLRPRDADCSKK
jgi:hypothetical protein